MIDYQILSTRAEKDRYREAIQDLFLRIFGRPFGSGDWEHFFLDAPYPSGCTVVAVAEDRVVGTANFVPQKLALNGAVLDYFLFTTSMVDPDYRRQGVYIRTTRRGIEAARAAGASLVIAFPNDVAVRPLTTLFAFKPLADIPIVSGSLDELGEITPLRQRRSVRLDEDFIRWRFEHRAYFRVSLGNKVLVCKKYLDGTDIVEVLADPPPVLRDRLPESKEPLRAVNVLSTRCATPNRGNTLTTLHATCYRIEKDIDPAQIDLSLLMWDVA